jgi:hypothetical protein
VLRNDTQANVWQHPGEKKAKTNPGQSEDWIQRKNSFHELSKARLLTVVGMLPLARGHKNPVRLLIQRLAGTLTGKTAALCVTTQHWSNGQVEGQVHRIKLLKRQMYGRSGFALLRHRVLPFPSPHPVLSP